MLNNLRIENFKGWKDTETISLAPLTILFGGNSSGKSSIGQFLMMLKQSAESSDIKTVLFSGNELTDVSLGMPSDMLYCHNYEEHIKFNYTWTLNKVNTIIDTLHGKKTYKYNSVQFSCEIGIPDEQVPSFEVYNFAYDLFLDNEFQMQVGMQRSDENITRRGYKLTSENYELTRWSGRAWDIKSPVKFYGFPDETVAYYKNTLFLRTLNLIQENLFSEVYYLGPLRTKAKRYYPWPGNSPASVGPAGEYTVAAILAATNEQRMLNFKSRNLLRPFEEVIARTLKKMELIDEFQIRKIAENRQDYEVKVKTKGSSNWADIPDVGFGVSQVLPVIVQLFYAPPGSIIIMEQPELHLHPSAQAHLADIMIDALNAREDAVNRNIQLIIETHSEHFLRRLQRRIAENENMTASRVRAYFADNSLMPTTLEPLQIDLYGDIANWPEGFFGDISDDISYQTTAALKQRIKSRDSNE